MKLCVDAREFVEPRKTGIGRYVENLLVSLLAEPGMEIVLFVNDPSFVPASLRRSSVKCVVLPPASTPFVDQIMLPRLTEKENADVFFSPYYKVPLWGRFKRIITVHDIAFLRLPSTNVLRKFVQRIQIGLAVKKTDTILVDSEFTRGDLAALIPSAAGKSRVLYPPLDASWEKPVDNTSVEKARMTYAGGRPFFLYVGNFKPHKNVDMLVDAFLRLEAEDDPLDRRLVLAGGDSDNLPRIESVVRSHDKRGVIKICPNIADSELKALYSAAEWFVTASRYEGFGYPLAEAMCCGCPVICSPCTSMPEVTGGICLPIANLTVRGIVDALRQAVAISPDRRLELIQAGKVAVRRFQSGSASTLFSELLRSLT